MFIISFNHSKEFTNDKINPVLVHMSLGISEFRKQRNKYVTYQLWSVLYQDSTGAKVKAKAGGGLVEINQGGDRLRPKGWKCQGNSVLADEKGASASGKCSQSKASKAEIITVSDIVSDI